MGITTKKQAILILSDKSSEWIIQNYNTIEKSVSEDYDVLFLYHQKNNYFPDEVKNINHFVFTDEILSELKYQPLTNTLIPGSNHFPLLKFYLQNPHYNYYWNIEDDVCFQGNWSNLFNTFVDCDADFISSHIASFDELPNWYWWFSLNSNGQDIPMKNKVRSFNPIYRLSNRALALLDHSLQNGWSGHHEVVIPTLLFHNNLKISDFGGIGSFVPKGNENKFYNEKSMSYLPIEMGNVENQIYHPIKEKKKIDINTLKKYCIISTVGQRSLHKEWINESSDFDLHLIIYDNSYNKFYNDTDFITYQKGHKFKLVYDYILKNPVYLEKYEYFFIPDDDVRIDSKNISKLFSYMNEFELEIAQPAISDSRYRYNQTIRNRDALLHYCNVVEMTMPCFSRKALKKVLFTFNGDKRGWGIEYHWPVLIRFTGKEMAIVDDIIAFYKFPNQSYNAKKSIENLNYIEKHKLKKDIKECGFVPNSNFQITSSNNWNPIITNIEEYKACEVRLISIANILYDNINSFKNSGLFDGRTAVSLFLLNYYELTGNKKYLDMSLYIIELTNESLNLVKDNNTFSEGLSGISWYIEYLAQHEYIENNTDGILEEICIQLNKINFYSISDISLSKGLIGYGMHFLSRMCNSNFSIHKNINLEEKNICSAIINLIIDYFLKLQIQDKELSESNEIAEIILFLCQLQKIEEYREISNGILQESVCVLKEWACFENIVSANDLNHNQQEFLIQRLYNKLYTLYALFTASKVLVNKDLEVLSTEKALKILEYNNYKDFDIKDFKRGVGIVHLSNLFYQHTKIEKFKNIALFRIDQFLNENNGENTSAFIEKGIDIRILNELSGAGLVLISAMSEFKLDWDKCLLM